MPLEHQKDESGYYHVEIAWNGLNYILFPVAADYATVVRTNDVFINICVLHDYLFSNLNCSLVHISLSLSQFQSKYSFGAFPVVM